MFPLPPGSKLNRMSAVRGPHYLHGPIRYSSALFAAFQSRGPADLFSAARTNLVSRQGKPFPFIENRRRPSPFFQSFLPASSPIKSRARLRLACGPKLAGATPRIERLILIMSRPNLPSFIRYRDRFRVDKDRPFPETASFRLATDGYLGNGKTSPVARGQKVSAPSLIDGCRQPLK